MIELNGLTKRAVLRSAAGTITTAVAVLFTPPILRDS